MDLDKSSKPNDGTRSITRRHLMNQQHSTQKQSHCPKPQHNTACTKHTPRHRLQSNECWRKADHMAFSSPCSHDSQTSCNNGQSIIVPHQLRTSSSTDIPTPRAPQRFITNFHIFETTHVGNIWNSAWNTTLTLIHRRPDSIVLQTNTNKYLFLSTYNNHPQQRKHYSNRTRKKKTGTRNPFTRIALTTKWTKLTRDITVILPRGKGPLARTPQRKITLPAKHALIRNSEWDWHSMNSTLSRSDSQHKHPKTTVSHTSHVTKEASESKRRCVSSETSSPCDLNNDYNAGFTHHTRKHLRYKREANNSKQTQGTTCDDAQCNVKSRREKLLSVNSDLEKKKLENPVLRATHAKIMIILGALWNTALICLANHSTRIDIWILIADTDVTNAQKSNLQREIHLGQAHRRTSMNPNTEPWWLRSKTHLELTTGHFSICGK